jgi:hypothetical protein
MTFVTGLALGPENKVVKAIMRIVDRVIGRAIIKEALYATGRAPLLF